MPRVASNNLFTHHPISLAINSLPMANIIGSQVGAHSIDDLMQRVSQRLDMDMEKTFVALAQKVDASPHIRTENKCMVATLQAVNGALQEAGMHLVSHQTLPAEIEELIKRTAALTLDRLADRKRSFAPDDQNDINRLIASAPRPNFNPARMALHLHEIEPLQRRLSDDPMSPFAHVEAHQRWRMCLDPSKVHYVETHVQGAKDNPLLPFMFDSDPSYLHGLLNGWHTAMSNLSGSLDMDFVFKLHRACYQSTWPFERIPFTVNFRLDEGFNMTPEGAKQLKAFAKTLRQTIPEYAVIKDEETYQAFLKARMANPAAQPDDNFTKHALLLKPGVSFAVVRKEIKAFITKYNNQVKNNPDATRPQRLTRVIELCQKLEQLHPFPDANARTFGILLLNHLLVRENLQLTMLDDPNILDGWSTAEIAQALETGQAQVAKWSINDDRSKPKASPRTCLGTFNLSKLLRKQT